MSDDEARLYDPTEGDEESESTLNIDAAPSSNSATMKVKHRWFILEPAVFLVFLSMYLSATVYQNQLLYQTCIYIKHHNATECEPLLGVEPETEEVQVSVTLFFVINLNKKNTVFGES
ncbi:hypothetical protein DOY81_010238 [Sarcophaga bullata]|nr:hypothetical protein DOY81_010238 [Sarcophaga bullata]